MRKDYVSYEPEQEPKRRRTDEPAEPFDDVTGFGWGMLLGAIAFTALIILTVWLS